jgi:hypothetical protein
MDALFWITSKLSRQARTSEEQRLNDKLVELVMHSSPETLAAVIEEYAADKENDFGDPDYSS